MRFRLLAALLLCGGIFSFATIGAPSSAFAQDEEDPEPWSYSWVFLNRLTISPTLPTWVVCFLVLFSSSTGTALPEISTNLLWI